MKYIKRKSAVKPITGSIVDTFNIDDKTKNTYSCNIIENLCGMNLEWKNANMNTEYIDSGTCSYIQLGKLLVIHFSDIRLKKEITASGTVLFNGFPPLSGGQTFMIHGDNATHFRLWADGDSVMTWYDNKPVDNALYYGELICLTRVSA